MKHEVRYVLGPQVSKSIATHIKYPHHMPFSSQFHCCLYNGRYVSIAQGPSACIDDTFSMAEVSPHSWAWN
jgi:hypothetical protein